ncbi:hypothetical protein Athai_48140 [Actinocatenispora thailandica]|uniref:ABC transporter n=1 Tax=Actinocatenispora thailandica TaxID=227318 RepID=A0A7R7HZ70_9ACTN|nr:ATP-binding cassette domain-containing protein [Actinocatenispora thailandica]BCJ37311.1 hypothetical protein Athai_48140 [Actinocatenispora thailandica]
MDDRDYRRAVAVLRALTTGTGHPVRVPLGPAPADPRAAVAAVAGRSGIRLHRITLGPAWWRVNLGPLLCWTGAPVRPAVLLFRGRCYRRVDPDTGAVQRISAAVAAELGDCAERPVLPVPAGTGAGGLLRRALHGSRAELVRLVLAGALVAAFSLATPLVSGVVFGALVDGAGVSLLSGLTLAYGAASVLASLLGVAANLRVLRLEGILRYDTELPLWDALLRLPARFFTHRGAGEITDIALSMSVTRDNLAGLPVQLVGATFTVLLEFVLLLVVSPVLAALAAALIGLALLALLPLFRVAARRQREALPREFGMITLTNQVLSGIERIHLSAAQRRVFDRWSGRNREAQRSVRRVRWAHALPTVLASMLPMAAQLILYALAVGPASAILTPQRFFTVNAAFGLLFGSATVLFAGAATVVLVLPRMNWVGTVLAAPRERQEAGADPGALRGAIGFRQVSFGYRSDGPALIPDLDLEIAPGEFVAVVGPSGSGKSTLLRLLLGFETPSAGQVRYDGRDLATLDLAAVRRQCGVVLQHSSLLPGTVRENVAGGDGDPAEVQRALRLAGLADEVAGWPMGLETIVAAGTSTVSVGQAQRILLARALVRRPRILLLDEATSALDNRTQQVVVANLAALRVTRLVVAHRLSTVLDADRIVVLDEGRIVQQGTPALLRADTTGPFHRLARRQLLTDPEPDARRYDAVAD